MYQGLKIEPPFEIGPKAFMYGERILKLAKAADVASKKYDDGTDCNAIHNYSPT